jgi:hypothetical protein
MLSLRDRAILEYCAEGLSNHAIAIQPRVDFREVSRLCGQAAAKLAARINSAHPFQIHEVVLAEALDSAESKDFSRPLPSV